MRRKWIFFVLGGLIVGGLGLAVLNSPSGAQVNDNGGGKAPKVAEQLPIRQVVLFNSGVGYFQREGDVDGTSRIDLSFPATDINDLLKSLVLQDLGGGRVSTVSYDSHDPIDKILRSFALDLNNNPTFGQILNQARGEKVEILLRADKKDGPQNKLQGSIVGMEVKRKPAGKDMPAMVEEEHLNLSTAGGLQSISLESVFSIRFLNPVLDNEFQRALKVLAGSHDTMKKTVSLGFAGNGKRGVRVGYVLERPIWKTSYRLRLEPGGKVFLQGWAIVENPSDDDWNDVRMVLVSGKPISYQMNLYEPLYIPRPFVESETFASLRPPVYSGALMDDGKGNPKMPVGQGQGPMQQGNFNPGPGCLGGGGFQLGGFNMGGFQLGGGGFQLGGNANADQFRYQRNELSLMQQNFGNKLTYDELQKRRQEQAAQKDDAKKKGSAIAMNFKEGIQSVATAEEVGDYYQYVLDQRINLTRQKSAMLPIIDQTIDGSKISIYNESIHSKYPLLGLRLKNTSGQPLTQGPITVYDDGTYAGDTRVLDLQPGEERLLSYALDQTTEVKTSSKSTPSPEMNFKIGDNNLAARYKMRQTTTYAMKNRSTHDRTVVIEHPIRTDWALIDPTKPNEKSRNMYRFIVPAPSNKTVSFDVVEEQTRLDSVALSTPSGTPLYATGLGIEVKPVLTKNEAKLIGLKIEKGFLVPRTKVREEKTYFVQNLSDQDRTFAIDHLIRPEWVLQGQEEKRGPAVQRFTLTVSKGKTGVQDIAEEKVTVEKSKLLKDVGETKIKEFLNSPVPSAEVKAALTKSLALAAKLAESKATLAEVNAQLDELSKDQARLRENLKIIPQTSDPYKKFLDKFVNQESEIEAFQKQIRQLTATVQTQSREYEVFVAKLDAE